MLKLVTVLFLCCIMIAARGQGCSELLSQAEQAYRDGRFEDIKPRLCKCFDIYRPDGQTGILPKSYRPMIAEMQDADTLYPQQLGAFREYWNDFIQTETQYKNQLESFSYTEKSRAFLLLGKVYNQLGIIRLAEYFALRSALIDPAPQQSNDNSGFGRIYDRQLKRVGEWSFGPALGWLYSITTSQLNNMPGNTQYHYQTDGKIMLGGQASYALKPTLIINLNLLINSTRVIYTQNQQAPAGNFDFYLSEKQNWIRMPLLLKFSSPNHLNWLKKSDGMHAKIFFATGFSLSYLTVSRATILDLPSATALYDYNVSDSRRRMNYEYIFQVLCRFTPGRNYLNIAFTGSYMLNRIVRQDLVGTSASALYSNYGIKENSYRLLTGTWTVYYEFRHTRAKREKSRSSE